MNNIKIFRTKIFLIAFCGFLITCNKTFSQIAIDWQKCLHVDSSFGDYTNSVSQTTDGGFILGCQSNSDFCLIKTDSLGNKQWSNTFGGSFEDLSLSAIQTIDGGYILSGYTRSNDGDITGFHGGQTDAWVVKTDNNGVLLWQKTFGGSKDDFFRSLVQNQEGEYIAVGVTASTDFDLIGLNPTGGGMWIVKFDSIGMILDQKLLVGGNGLKIIKTNDNGYAIAGPGSSVGTPVDAFDTAYGLQDYGIVKLDSALNTQWTKIYGGTNADVAQDIIQTSDGYFVVSGVTLSNDVFVSGNHGFNTGDYWIIKLDSSGNFLWQRCLGTVLSDYDVSVVENANGKFIIAGNIWPNNFSIIDSIAVLYGFSDIWLVELDEAGNLIWEKTIGGGNHDGCASIIQINDHEYIIAGFTSSNDFDVSGKIGVYTNAWIVKFVDEPNSVTGKLYTDANSNLNYDSGEFVLPLKEVRETASNRMAYSYSNGNYRLDLSFDGNCIITTDSIRYYNCIPALYNKAFTGFNNLDSLNDFAFQPIGTVNDLKIEITNVSNLRPGFQTDYRITFKNIGTTVLSGDIILLKSNLLGYSNASLTPALITTDSIQWIFSNLNPFEARNIDVSFLVSISATLGSLMQSTAIINPITGDSMPLNNIVIDSQLVVGSFDPNDISVNEDTLGLSPQVNPEFLEYTIRFQNTGTASATLVRITNPISDFLEMGSFELISASHEVSMNFFQHSRNMEFVFDSINLPDSNTNEPASHGFIRYRIKPLSNLNPGDTISNQANIYFDYNPVVSTNITNTVVINCDSIISFQYPISVSCYGDSLVAQALLLIPIKVSWYVDSIFTTNNEVLNLINLPVGNHVLWLSASNNFCTINNINTVTILPVPSINLGTDTSTCNLPVIFDAGSGFISYLWNTGDTLQTMIGMSTNNYMVTVTDSAGCKNTDSIHLTINSLPFIDLGNDTSACEDLKVDAGIGFISYLWSDGGTAQNIVINSTNQYFVEVTDSNGCINTDSINVWIDPLPVVTLNAFIVDTICLNNGQQTINSGNPNGGILSGTGVSGNIFDPNLTGIGWQLITYEFTDSLGCTNTAIDSVLVDLCLGVNSYQNNDEIKIYPNPATNNIHIICSDTKVSYNGFIYDMFGIELKQIKISYEKNEIDISDLPQGNYILIVHNHHNVIYIQRLVKIN